MKYTKQTDLELMRALELRLQDAFSFKLSVDKVTNYVSEFLNYHLLTDNGNSRYPQSTGKALRLYWITRQQALEYERLIWCYEIDGVLYTTYKKGAERFAFSGETSIQNYRDANKEDRLLELERSGDTVKRGFYYPCGKPFYNV